MFKDHQIFETNNLIFNSTNYYTFSQINKIVYNINNLSWNIPKSAKSLFIKI